MAAAVLGSQRFPIHVSEPADAGFEAQAGGDLAQSRVLGSVSNDAQLELRNPVAQQRGAPKQYLNALARIEPAHA
jgi:hypothetical protein